MAVSNKDIFASRMKSLHTKEEARRKRVAASTAELSAKVITGESRSAIDKLSDFAATKVMADIAQEEAAVEQSLKKQFESGNLAEVFIQYQRSIQEIYYASVNESTEDPMAGADRIKNFYLPELDDILENIKQENDTVLSDEQKETLITLGTKVKGLLESRTGTLKKLSFGLGKLFKSSVLTGVLAAAAARSPALALALFAMQQGSGEKATKTNQVGESMSLLRNKLQRQQERASRSTAPVASTGSMVGSETNSLTEGITPEDTEGITPEDIAPSEKKSRRKMGGALGNASDLSKLSLDITTELGSILLDHTKLLTHIDDSLVTIYDVLSDDFKLQQSMYNSQLLANEELRLENQNADEYSGISGMDASTITLGSDDMGPQKKPQGGPSLGNFLPKIPLSFGAAAPALAFTAGGAMGALGFAAAFKAIAGPALDAKRYYNKANEYGIKDTTGGIVAISKRIREYERSKNLPLSDEARLIVDENGKPFTAPPTDPRLDATATPAKPPAAPTTATPAAATPAPGSDPAAAVQRPYTVEGDGLPQEESQLPATAPLIPEQPAAPPAVAPSIPKQSATPQAAKQPTAPPTTASRQPQNMSPTPATEDTITKIIEVGKGFNVVQYANGSVEKRVGNRNWRNNNPGNIRKSDYATSKGAIGDDGEFAIFPTLEMGRKAKSDLLFKGKNYKNLNIAKAIARYAPETENNTEAYIQTVLAATGATRDTNLNTLDDTQKENFLKAIERQEGFKVGRITRTTSLQAAATSTPTDIDMGARGRAQIASNMSNPMYGPPMGGGGSSSGDVNVNKTTIAGGGGGGASGQPIQTPVSGDSMIRILTGMA